MLPSQHWLGREQRKAPETDIEGKLPIPEEGRRFTQSHSDKLVQLIILVLTQIALRTKDLFVT